MRPGPITSTVALLLLVASVSAAAETAQAAVKKCPPGAVALVAKGKRTCVPRARFRPTVKPVSPTVATVSGYLATPLRLTRRSTNRRVAVRTVSPALARNVATQLGRMEIALRDAARAALFKTTASRTRTAEGPSVSISTNGDGSVTGRLSQTVAGGGDKATVDLGINARNANGEMTFALDLQITVEKGDGTTMSSGFAFKDLNSKPRPSCPTADGVVDLNAKWAGGLRKSETFGGKRVHLGVSRTGGSLQGTVTATARMGADATLRPFPFSVSATLDVSMTAQALAFFGYRIRAVGKGTLTGTMNPATGQITGATATTNVTVSGLSAADAASTRPKLQASLEKQLRDMAGRMRDAAKEVEEKARTGGCTTLVFAPESPGALPPNADVNVGTRLETKGGGATVPKVSWTTSPAKGSVSPSSASTAQPSWAIHGAAQGPETARINVRAVSPAGISEGVWIGNVDFPLSYSGTVSYTEDATGFVTTWSGTFTWRRQSTQANPDGTRSALYALTSASVSPFTVSGSCTGGTSGPSGTIQFGDIQIGIDAAGNWTSAFVVDVAVTPFPISCPPAPPTLFTNPKAFLNSASPSGKRAMQPAGPITATNVTDAGIPQLSPVSSWSLQPGG